MNAFVDSDTKPVEETNKDGGTNTYLDKLVASKGENWRDVETLAKGKLESDAYIEQLKAEVEQLKAGQSQQDYAKEVLEALQNNKTTETANVSEENSRTQDGNTNQSVSEDALKSLVENVVTQRERQATVSANLQTVNTQLEQVYGDKAADVVKTKAAELNMSVDRLKALAEESPTAFFNLVPAEKKEEQKGAFDSTSSTNRTQAGGNTNTGERNQSYYTQLRKEKPELWRSPAIQRQMAMDFNRLGEQFLN